MTKFHENPSGDSGENNEEVKEAEEGGEALSTDLPSLPDSANVAERPAGVVPPTTNTDDDIKTTTNTDDDIKTSQNPIKTTPQKPKPINPLWTHLTEGFLHRGIRQFNVFLAVLATRHPKRCIVLITLLSFGLVIVGFFTNFQLLYSHQDIFTPFGSKAYQHGKWLEKESNFTTYEELSFMVHSDGKDVMNKDAIRRLFYALNSLRNVSGYDSVCSQSSFFNVKGEPTCWIWSATNFWSHNVTEFEATVKSDEDVQRQLSQTRFPDQTPVFPEALFGQYEAVNETFVYNAIADDVFYYQHANPFLIYVPTYFVSIGLPQIDETYVFQEKALKVFETIRNNWLSQGPNVNPHNLQLEFFSSYAYELEYERALNNDIPLVPVIFFVMIGFTCFIFHRYGRQQPGAPTRATIGLASVVTIGMAMMSGFGLMFCIGIPFTNITLMAPFIILGIGLDDTFIITGAYFRKLNEDIERQERPERKNQSTKEALLDMSSFDDVTSGQDADAGDQQPIRDGSSTSAIDQLYDHTVIEERVRSAVQEVSLSISMTTITTVTAFVLGCASSIPGIRWLCLYAGSAIIFDFIYQITYFLALLVLDERRVVLAQAKEQAKSRGRHGENQQSANTKCCSFFPCSSRYHMADNNNNNNIEDAANDDHNQSQSKNRVFIERCMSWYARKLVLPNVRNSVIALCVALFAVCLYSTSQLEQKFESQDYVSKDSYARGFLSKLEEYASLSVALEVYFRFVDQSDPLIQRQMQDYVYQMSSLPAIGEPPYFCWVTDILGFLDGDSSDVKFALTEEQIETAKILADSLQQGNRTFDEKLDIVLNIPAIRDVYGTDIVRDQGTGKITASRCYLYLQYFDLQDISDQVNFLYDQRDVSEAQPINQLPEYKNDWAFFGHSNLHGYWEVYTIAIQELIFSTVMGVIAVCFVGLVIIPHWSGMCFVGPLIVMLYFDLLGVMQFCGIKINAVTYVTIVISIGLLVDFLMHILLRYYETPGSTREAKVIQTLETMGVSMTLGGFTTWLGVIPLAFSSTKIFMTLFIAFLAMVSLGLLIGLSFLPAVLSICGPLVCVSNTQQESGKKTLQQPREAQGISPNKTLETMESPSSCSQTSDTGDDAKVLRLTDSTPQLDRKLEPLFESHLEDGECQQEESVGDDIKTNRLEDSRNMPESDLGLLSDGQVEKGDHNQEPEQQEKKAEVGRLSDEMGLSSSCQRWSDGSEEASATEVSPGETNRQQEEERKKEHPVHNESAAVDMKLTFGDSGEPVAPALSREGNDGEK